MKCVARKKKQHKRLLNNARTCHYCHCALNRSNATLDHIVPIARGGTMALLNLVTACQKDNSAKADDLPWCRCQQCVAAMLHYLGVEATRSWFRGAPSPVAAQAHTSTAIARDLGAGCLASVG